MQVYVHAFLDMHVCKCELKKHTSLSPSTSFILYTNIGLQTLFVTFFIGVGAGEAKASPVLKTYHTLFQLPHPT